MPLLTFISDFGTKDPYVALVKGALFTAIHNVQIIDISHQIAAHDLMEAAAVLKAVYPKFPSGTIHLMGLESTHESALGKYIAVNFEGSHFLLSDNGLINLVLDVENAQCYSLESRPTTFGTLDILVPAAVQLFQGIPPSDLGPLCRPIKMLERSVRVTKENLKGLVVYIDHFGNLHTNIYADAIHKHALGTNFKIIIGRTNLIEISKAFHEVPEGELLAFWGNIGQLVIAIRGGKASSLLGMSVDSPIWIEFD